ncbi:MAG: hypothetical protein B7733_23135 [Myxococcales bacterium FL481]|nr:MAG: hypothetical protein B7733_23135 [Myxococcales bacterium FL481]
MTWPNQTRGGARQPHAAWGELFFGRDKWGFVRAFTEKTQASIIKRHGLEIRDAAVFKWPDDFS